MPRLAHLLVPVLAGVAAAACTTTHHVVRPRSPEAFLMLASGQDAPIVLLHPEPYRAPTDATLASRSPRRPTPGTTREEDLIMVAPDGVVVASPEGPLHLKLDDVQGYRVRRTGMGLLEGMGIGVLSGALAGAALGYSGGDDPPCMDNGFLGCFLYVRETATEKARIGGTLGGLAGLLVGGIVGAALGHTDVYLF
jgi:hypothetical protein